MPGEIIQNRLKELFNYDSYTGVFTRKVSVKGRKAKRGTIAGTAHGGGYFKISIDGSDYYAHRLAWLYTYGYMPENIVDHIDRDPSNNRMNNLREVSVSCNTRNAKIYSTNKSGITGVNWYKNGNKWRAQIKTIHKDTCIGLYDDFSEAVCARLAAEQCLNWEGCSSTSPAYKYVKEELHEQK